MQAGWGSITVLVLVGCSQANGAQPQPASAPLEPSRVSGMSRALFDALDRADESAAAAALGAQFVSIETDDVKTRQDVLGKLRERKARSAPPRTREYLQERSWSAEGSAVHLVRTLEHYPLDGALPNRDFDGWYTLVWARERGAWKAVTLQWMKAGRDAEREMWNDVYRDGVSFNPRPNRFLSEMAEGRPPGRALDVGMGQGRNAIYLAQRGWKVTGIDISDEGLRQARAAAVANAVPLDAVEADIESWNYGVAQWDLVALIYSGCKPKTAAAIQASVKPGGLIVSERFHKQSLPIGTDPEELAKLFGDGFDILRNDVVEEVSDWGNQRGVAQKLVRFAARKR